MSAHARRIEGDLIMYNVNKDTKFDLHNFIDLCFSPTGVCQTLVEIKQSYNRNKRFWAFIALWQKKNNLTMEAQRF